MKRIIILMIIVFMSGCSNELEVANIRIAELEASLEESLNSETVLKEDLVSKETGYSELENEYEMLFENYNSTLEEVQAYERILEWVPYYISDIFVDNLKYGLQEPIMVTPKPDDSYLLIDDGKMIGGYNVFEAEEGPCEAAIHWYVYEDEGFTYRYFTNAGCNPNWIDTTPIYLNVDKSLISVEMAIDLGYITVTDLEESGYFSKEPK